ncbi:MAG: sugar transporter [Bacteroidetes bacterium]|nr:MAG: sugar transporter [Bacteroidota bacterium]
MRFIATTKRTKLAFAVLFGFCVTSCTSTKEAVYFTNASEGLVRSLPEPEAIIQKNDILSISVSSLNPEASLIFNTPNVPSAAINVQGTQYWGYLVNSDGQIQFPVLGNVQAAGLTKKQFKDQLTKTLLDKKLLVDPIVSIRFLNFRVTVLGEVGHPQVVTVPSEKISILEALGMAGDMTIYAKRDNVLLIREDNNGQKLLKRLDLNTSEIFNSPYYFLKSNDIVYVEPNKSKLNSVSTSRQLLPLVLSGLSFLAVILTAIVK